MPLNEFEVVKQNVFMIQSCRQQAFSGKGRTKQQKTVNFLRNQRSGDQMFDDVSVLQTEILRPSDVSASFMQMRISSENFCLDPLRGTP